MNLTNNLGIWLLLGLLPATSFGQIGFRQITSTHPVAVQRGVDSEIVVRSNFTLDGCYRTFMDRPGMTLDFAETKPINAPRQGRGSVGTPFKFQAKVPADCPLGLRELRFATPQAVSSVGMLMVTDFPVVVEQAKNDRPEESQTVALPAAVCGSIENREDVDYFKFHAAKGQTLVFEMFAQRVTQKLHNLIAGGNYLMDSILTLYDSSGREIAQNDDYFGGDSLLIHTFTQDGDYVLSVRDVRYNGHTCYTYCVEISDRPFVQSSFPLAVQRGKETPLRLSGHNLPENATATFTAAADFAVGEVITELTVGEATTNPVTLLVSDWEQIEEKIDAGPLLAGTAIEFPRGINGQLSKPGEVDHYVFAAKKGEGFVFEIVARNLGSLADTTLVLRNAEGKQLALNDDATAGLKDSSLTWTAPADGSYVLEVAELGGNGGEGFAYHVRANRAEPDFQFRGEYYYAMLAPGNNMIWFVRATRQNGFAGPISFTVEGLPPGVTAVPLTLPGHMNDGAIILQAAADAKVDASLVRIKGTAEVPGADGKPKTLERLGSVTCEIQNQGGGQGRWPINTQIVGVTEKMDLEFVTATPAEIVLSPGQQATIDVELKRHPDYAGKTVTLDMEFKYFNSVLGSQLPPGVTMSTKSQTRLTNNIAKGTVILEAASTAKPVEKIPIAPIAGVSVSFSISTLYCSNPVYLTVLDPNAKPQPVAQVE